MRSKFRWQRVVSPLFYAAIAAALVYYLREADWRVLNELDADPVYLIVAVPFSLAPRLIQPLAWAALIRDYGHRPPPYPQLALVYAKSWLARYIPGKLAWIGGKILFGSRYGVGARVLAVTSIAEAGIQIVTALGLSFLLFALGGELGRLGAGLRLFSVIAFCTMSIALVPPVFNAVVARVQALTLTANEPPVDGHRLSLGAVIGVAALYVGIHLLSALPLFLLLKAVYPLISPGHVGYVTASFLLAGSLGTLAVFAPSGIGVREGVLIVLLGAVIPKEVTLLAVLFLRLWAIAMDLAFYGVAALLDRSHPEAPGTV